MSARCNECGGTELSWELFTRLANGAAMDGRLRKSEVVPQLVLGCDECSAIVDVAETAEQVFLLTPGTEYGLVSSSQSMEHAYYKAVLEELREDRWVPRRVYLCGCAPSRICARHTTERTTDHFYPERV
jgi:hypothetical protein